MEERDIFGVLHEMFEKALPLLKMVREAFDRENGNAIKEQSKKFGEIIKSSIPFFESIVQRKDKEEADKKAVELLLTAQMMAAAIENLLNKMVLKVEADVLFSEKAKREITELMEELESELKDLSDFIITKDPELKKRIEDKTQKILKMAHEFDSTHQRRLITGICMPKASYIYIDMTESIRKISREMKNLAEKV